jgi:hypothetical protein
MQRFESFTAPHAMVFERRLTEFSCRSRREGLHAGSRPCPADGVEKLPDVKYAYCMFMG